LFACFAAHFSSSRCFVLISFSFPVGVFILTPLVIDLICCECLPGFRHR
jgi:hypothetical protein